MTGYKEKNMKRIVLMAVAFVFTAVAAIAQNLPNGVSMSFWGQMVFIPFELRINQNQPGDIEPMDNMTTGIGPGWGLRTNGATSITLKGNTTNFGFGLEIGIDETIRIGENAFVWARPFGKWLRLDAGVFVDNEFRGSGILGNFDFGEFNMTGIFSRDFIFNRFSSVSDDFDTAAALLRVYPIRGLTIAAFMSVRGSDLSAAPVNASGPGLRSSVDRIQVAIGYRIPKVGLVRVQFLNAPEFTYSGTPSGENLYGGRWNNSQWGEYNSARYYNEFKRLEVAFRLTAVKNLNFDIGSKIPFYEIKDGVKYKAPIVTAFTVGYKIGDFVIDLNTVGWFGGGINGEGRDIPFAPKVIAHLYPQYNLGFATIAGIIGLDAKGVDIFNGLEVKNSDNVDLCFGVFMIKKFNNGDIKGGLTYTMPDVTNRLNNYRTIGWFRVPIVMELYFW